MSKLRREIWLPIVPETTKRPASLPANWATWASRFAVVSSSLKTSSRSVQELMAFNMAGVGTVMTSPVNKLSADTIFRNSLS